MTYVLDLAAARARALSKNFGAPTQGVWMWAAPGPRAPPIACLEGRGTNGRASSVKHNLGALKVRIATFNEKKTISFSGTKNTKYLSSDATYVKRFTPRRFIFDERRPNAGRLAIRGPDFEAAGLGHGLVPDDGGARSSPHQNLALRLSPPMPLSLGTLRFFNSRSIACCVRRITMGLSFVRAFPVRTSRSISNRQIQTSSRSGAGSTQNSTPL